MAPALPSHGATEGASGRGGGKGKGGGRGVHGRRWLRCIPACPRPLAGSVFPHVTRESSLGGRKIIHVAALICGT